MENIEQKIRAFEAYDNKYMAESDVQMLAIKWARKLRIPERFHQDFALVILKIYEITIKVKNEVIAFGRILINKLIEFIKENKEVVIGAFVGFIFGIALTFIPLIGPIIAGFAPFLGAAYAQAQKMIKNGEINASESALGQLFKGATEIVLKFYNLVEDIISEYNAYRKKAQQ